ncbi:hypothetical protein ABB37_01145 [Leptomonas pyrrhocoris]|uniref:Uncharacterized protein n=1 Tax=Leptomonas pyrrhocoris TaxID=157538 RepID=A0A0M9G875_LEPPY|nr:hypothetical protein ABB37_01145 [Leptomonas pyrrhocoris]XP_015663062.1 hypothetical protein ABB37_01145 [Leptomonas pyrrhocoris]KPA84622.1 hypothetical protein ABB37_01145 [Leptomonas pyrrhocoris]KPA84623.1 hypothetical protein ABB37_01145 [Leptomonas pyrrhocoris]|eukprot:XP_015663061.1 hypothetical protein ABB37_01145 [Leptomonas pyrrhocoris]
MSSSSSSSSPPPDVVVSDSGSDEDTSFVVREIRQLPLPSAPTALSQDRTAAPAQPSGGSFLSAVPPPTHPAQPAPTAAVPAIPFPSLNTSTLHRPAAPDAHVARLPRPPVPLTTPHASTTGASHSDTFSSTSSSTATVPLLTTTVAGATASQGEEKRKKETGVTIPPVPLLPTASSSQPVASMVLPPSPQLSSATWKNSAPSLKSPATPIKTAADSSSPSIPTLAPVLAVPPPALAALHPAEQPNLATGGDTAIADSIPYAVTTLLPTIPSMSTDRAHGGVVLPPPPSQLVGAPSAAASAVATLPPSSSSRGAPAATTTVSAVAAPSVGTTAILSTPANNHHNREQERPRHLRRTRDALENADCALFTSPDTVANSPGSRSSSSGDGEDDDGAYVGRTRRVGSAALLEQRPSQPVGRGGERAAASKQCDLPPSHRHYPQHHSRSRSRSKPQQKTMVVRMREVEGKGGAVASREKTSLSSQSTNALTPDNAVEMRHHRPSPSASPLAEEEGGRGSMTIIDDEGRRDNDPPLTFTSPAARFAARCSENTKGVGPNGTNLPRLTHGSLRDFRKTHGIEAVDVAVEGDDDDDDDDRERNAGPDHARSGTVHFRFTGAFSDATSDSKMLSSAAHEVSDGKQHKTPKAGRGSGEAADSTGTATGGATVLSLNIRGMSPLHTDVSVVHPFVRAWVVSGATGTSLVQASAAVPCAVTQPFDIRAHKTRTPWWDAKVAVRLSTERLRSAGHDAMLLLEVLDFGNETIHGFPLLRSGLYPICWGFLMLRDYIGCSALAAGENVHVQLFRYPLRTPWYLIWLEALLPLSWSAAASHLQPYDLSTASGEGRSICSGSNVVVDVPNIYHIFKFYFNRKIPYEGEMVVTLRKHSDSRYVPDTTDMLPYEEYLLSVLVSGGGSCAVPRSTHAASRDHDGGDTEDRGSNGASKGLGASSVPASPWAPAAENYYRMDGERSLLPHEVLQTSAVMGIVTCVSFTHNGTLFALGVYRHLQYLVELRNPLLPDMPVVATLLGHTGHLHCVVFQREDRYMLSCSSDGTVRVWQPSHPNCQFNSDTCTGPSSVQCAFTLPHGFPVYTAIFHQDKIIAGGFSDQLFVWGYERPLEDDLPSTATADDSMLHLTATFTPQLQLTQSEDTAGRSTRVLLGELIYRVDNAGVLKDGGEPTITLSLASNERSNRAWSVHANGVVVCWRAVCESVERKARTTPPAAAATAAAAAVGPNWQMSVRHTVECSGASEVQVNGSYAIVVCRHAPLVFVFDATTCEQLRVVNTRLPAATPVSLLPDGEAFVGAVGDPSRLVAWECFDGGLCTAPTGYAQASPLYGVARMSWTESQQLSVMVSRSPCTQDDMVRFIRGPSAPAPGQSAAAYYYEKQEEEYRLQSIPSEMTLLTVAGTRRKRGTVIQTGGGRAAEAFCLMFGGDFKAKRKTEYLAERTRASRQRETERDSRRARLHQEALLADPSNMFASATTTVPYDATERGARMNAIINFWRGLVGQHKHGVEHLQRLDANASAGLPSPPQQSTRRALQYLDDNCNEAEV